MVIDKMSPEARALLDAEWRNFLESRESAL